MIRRGHGLRLRLREFDTRTYTDAQRRQAEAWREKGVLAFNRAETDEGSICTLTVQRVQLLRDRSAENQRDSRFRSSCPQPRSRAHVRVLTKPAS